MNMDDIMRGAGLYTGPLNTGPLNTGPLYSGQSNTGQLNTGPNTIFTFFQLPF